MQNKIVFKLFWVGIGSAFLLASIATLMAQRVTADSHIIYVDIDASGDDDGTTWEHAYNDLQDALGAADSGDEIWVADGTYTPGSTRESHFQLLNNIAIYGGFAATEMNRSERDWETNLTYLSGDLQGDDSNLNSTDHLINGDNSYHVIVGSGVNDTAILDGFWIVGGNADGVSPQNSGGGIYNSAGSPTLNNITFANNYARFGAAIYNSSSSSTISNSLFVYNVAVTPASIISTLANGGGVANYGSSNVTMENVEFIQNSAEASGGAIANYESSQLTVINGRFIANSAEQGGGLRNSGQSSANFINPLFADNHASKHGGAISNYDNSDLSLVNGTVVYNSADELGSAIRIALSSQLTVSNSIFWDNYTTPLLMAAATEDSDTTISFSDAPNSTGTISYSNVQNSGGSDDWNSDFGADGGNNIDLDPEFSYGDDWSTASFPAMLPAEFYLQIDAQSPAIDTGSNASYTSTTNVDTDNLGNDRINTTLIDRGAFEYQYQCTDGDTLHVDANRYDILAAMPSVDGSSWDEAYTDLQHALFIAKACDNITTIKVAEGNYSPGNEPEDSFELQNNLTILGGYPGYLYLDALSDSKLPFEERNPELYPTTLGQQPLLEPREIASLAATGNYHIITANGVDATAVLDGFNISGGWANGDDFPHDIGGGVLAVNSSAQLYNINFENNYAFSGGGAVANISSTVSISNSTFTSNNSSGDGGAVHNAYGSPSIIGSSFFGNGANNGGAIYNISSTVTISTSEFYTNTAGENGGAIYNKTSDAEIYRSEFVMNHAEDGLGGAFYNLNSSPKLELVCFAFNSTSSIFAPDVPYFWFCDAEGGRKPIRLLEQIESFGTRAFTAELDGDYGKGGAFFTEGGAPELLAAGFFGNSSGQGGAFYSLNASPKITEGVFVFNATPTTQIFEDAPSAAFIVETSYDGGAIYNNNSDLEFAYGDVVNNYAQNNGGGIYNLNSAPNFHQVAVAANEAFKGGGMFNDNSDPIFKDSLIADNYAAVDGGGAYNYKSSPEFLNTSVEYNFASDEGGGMFNEGSSASFVNTAFYRNIADTSFGGAMANYAGSHAMILNSTLAANIASNGGDGMYNNDSSPEIINSIIWGNGDNSGEVLTPTVELSVANNEGSSPKFSTSIVQSSGGSDAWNSAAGVDLGGNRDVDPLFEDISDDDVSLSIDSPAIDAGNTISYTSPVTTDVYSNPRIVNAIIDLGAAEGQFYLLNTYVDGNGSGDIIGLGNEINCGITCTQYFEANATVALDIEVDEGSAFSGWSGACDGLGGCEFDIENMSAVTATFKLITYPVTTDIMDDGLSTGSIELSPAADVYEYGTIVTATAVPSVGAEFLGWTGSITGTTNPISMTIDQAKSLTATFGIASYPVDLTVAGTGDGVITILPEQDEYEYGTQVVIIATADEESVFTGWSGDLNGFTNPYTLTVDSPKAITATMTFGSNVLAVTKDGSGTGNVSSSPVGIDCGGTCAADFDLDEVVTLTATADTGSLFSGWTGECSGSDSCAVTMDALKFVTATFTSQPQALTVILDGAGEGSVSSTPAGIDCGSVCTAGFVFDEIVTLKAVSNEGSTFFGWSGAGCSGTGTCIVTMDEAKSVRAIFAKTVDPEPPTTIEFDNTIFLPIIQCEGMICSGRR